MSKGGQETYTSLLACPRVTRASGTARTSPPSFWELPAPVGCRVAPIAGGAPSFLNGGGCHERESVVPRAREPEGSRGPPPGEAASPPAASSPGSAGRSDGAVDRAGYRQLAGRADPQQSAGDRQPAAGSDRQRGPRGRWPDGQRHQHRQRGAKPGDRPDQDDP